MRSRQTEWLKAGKVWKIFSVFSRCGWIRDWGRSFLLQTFSTFYPGLFSMFSCVLHSFQVSFWFPLRLLSFASIHPSSHPFLPLPTGALKWTLKSDCVKVWTLWMEPVTLWPLAEGHRLTSRNRSSYKLHAACGMKSFMKWEPTFGNPTSDLLLLVQFTKCTFAAIMYRINQMLWHYSEMPKWSLSSWQQMMKLFYN